MPRIPEHESSPEENPRIFHSEELASHVVYQIDEEWDVTDEKEGGEHGDRHARPVFPSARLGFTRRLTELYH